MKETTILNEKSKFKYCKKNNNKVIDDLIKFKLK